MPTSSHVVGNGLPSGSASSIISGVVRGYHLLKIVGYSGTKEIPNGEGIESCLFRVGGCTWNVRYYPNGLRSEYSDYIGLCLFLNDTVAGEVETVKEKFMFGLLDQHGKPVPSYTGTSDTREFSVHKGHGEFHTQETPSILVPPSDLHRHLGVLLSSKAGVNVKFQVGGETFSAHRLVLAARSPVFRAEFFGQTREGTTTEAIRVHDMEAPVFSALLTFMYTDALPDMKQEEEYALAQHLLVAVDKYNLERLKLICEDKLCNRIDTSSVVTILALAEQHQCHELKAACLVFLSSPTNLGAAMESEGFEFLTKSCSGVIKDLLKSQVAASILWKRKSRA
ncbi:BTB/POZ and MATH domain-containing protein 1-like [Triticum dicoccoides]|uniref:BTB/POZ and MATH domain-containing protein 1-like n=1 Tax=Triticum dicoccoides TaxID=85692 RepID=UPI00188F21F4|nr:BTB/POZ and MATH domain-containing protein 1-like [Triticum dicoccoides]